MQTLVAQGQSAQSPELAILNALSGVMGAAQGAEQFMVIIEGIQHTDEGFSVAVRVVLFNTEDLKKVAEKEEAEADNDNRPSSKPDGEDNFFDAAAYYSAQSIEQERQMIREQAEHELAHPVAEDLEYIFPSDFHEVAANDQPSEPPPGNTAQAAGMLADDVIAQHIVTKIDNWEIASASTYELLSSDNVKWNGPHPEPENANVPEEQMFEKPAEEKAKDSKEDSLDLVA